MTLIRHRPVVLDHVSRPPTETPPPAWHQAALPVSLAYVWSRQRLITRLILHQQQTWTALPVDLPDTFELNLPWTDLTLGLRLSADDVRHFLNERPDPSQIESGLQRARDAQQARYPDLFHVLHHPHAATLGTLRTAWKEQPIRTPVMRVTPRNWPVLMAGNAPAEHAGSRIFVIEDGQLTRRWSLPAGDRHGPADDTPAHGETRMLLHHSHQPAYPPMLLAVTIDAEAFDQPRSAPMPATLGTPGR